MLLLPITNLFSQAPTDCTNAIVVCGNSELNLDVSGIGIQELSGLNSCSSQENNSVWLKVTPITSGTLGFNLTPQSFSIQEDYDFFVFGPNADCNNLPQAIRCSTTNPQAAGQNNNLTGMNSTETDTSEGPGSNGNSFVRWLDVEAGDSYFIVIDRPIGNSPFTLEWTGTAQFSSPPTNETGSLEGLNLENCDTLAPYDDEVTGFNLDSNTPGIIGSQTNVIVSYYESESDANIDENAISGIYNNTSNPQEVFARMENTLTGCFEVIPFVLTVTSGPSFVTPTNLTSCDDFSDGDNLNGFTSFDLTTTIEEIQGNSENDSLNISFHESLDHAQNNTNPLPNDFTNTSPNDQIIYVRIEDSQFPDCFSTTTLNLTVLPAPEAFDTTLLQCDQDFSPDGITLFNLNEANSLVSNTPDQVSIAYFESFEEAQDNLQPLDYNYSNTTNPQIIFARVFDPSSGCYSISQVSLEVSTTQISDYEVPGVCDEPNSEDGINTFDLNEVALQIQNNNNISFPISFYSSYDDALLEENALEASYTNSIPYFQVIYARAENNNACYGIAEVTLRVHELPNLQSDGEVFYCLNDSPESITLNAGIFDGSTNNTFEWSTGETTPDIEVNTVGAYTVTATNVWGCSKSRTIVVSPSNIATIEALHVTDASENNTISIVVSGEGTYEFALFNQNGLFADFQPQTTFQNIPPGIYTVAVRDVKNDCGVVEDMVSVIGFPKYFTPNNDGQNDFWQIIGITQFTQPNTEILIFNRYGKLITKIDPLGMGWDGTLNGEPLPTDDYWFFITLQDGRIFKSHFTLKR